MVVFINPNYIPLTKKGYDVTILARGNRLNEIQKNGLILINDLTNKRLDIDVHAIDNLNENDVYDYVIVAVQNTQIGAILPVLSKNKSHAIVFAVNNPLGYDQWIKAVGYERIMIGFPSAGGERVDGKVYYFIGTGLAKLFQSTTFGELNGERTPRLRTLVRIFKDSGFSPTIGTNMDAWQKTHVAVILPVADALYKYNSNNYALSGSYNTLKQMILATRECFGMLKSLDIGIEPKKLNFYYLPLFLLVPLCMLIMRTKIAEFAMTRHAMVGKEEMIALKKQFESLTKDSKPLKCLDTF